MIASLVLAASMVGQFGTTLAPNIPSIYYQNPPASLPPNYYLKPAPTPEDLRIQAALDAYCMGPNDGCAGYTKTRFPGTPLRVVRTRLDAPAGLYLMYTLYAGPPPF